MYISEVKRKLIIKRLFDVVPSDFGTDDDYGDIMDGTDYDINHAISPLCEQYYYEHGASKFVAIDADEDFVIKIPFSGTWCLNDYENPRYIYDEELEEDVENPEFDEENEYAFSPFYEPDYCGVEEEIYYRAKDAGLDFLFAETRTIGRIKHCDIYAQERARVGASRVKQEISNENKTKAKKISEKCSYTISTKWLGAVIEWYGDEIAEKLLDFLDDNSVNDLHNGNVGYRLKDDAPILVDYSGFED